MTPASLKSEANTKPQVFYNHSTRQALGFQNPCYLKKAQQLKPKLYDGCIIEKSDAVVIPATEETLMLAEESRSKMIEKQNDPQMTEKKIELSAEQAFWFQYSVQNDEPNLSATTTIVEVPKNVTISQVYYVEGLGHNLFSVGQFCDSDLEVAFRQHTCFFRILDGVDLLTGSQGNNLYTLSLQDMMASSPICLLSKASKTNSWLWHRRLSHLNFGAINHLARQGLQNGVVERRNRTLIKAARTMLIYAQAPLFLCAEVVETVCFTQNRSIIRLRHGKTPYELMHGKQPDLSYFHVFGALCYPTNNGENVGKLQPKADIGIFIGYAPTKKAFRIYNRRTRRIGETIHVNFYELTAMASERSSSGPAL
nr:retrovirus-related Pol polyprotein from transposon TNT 1-94 [Tanacetum cinerariifolium]